MSTAILQGKSICKTFDDSNKEYLVLNNVSVDINKDDFTVIMGASGAGKTTLLYALSGMDTITGGNVLYKERNISNFSENEIAKLRLTEFGFVFQQPHLVSNLTLFENIAVAGYLNKNNSSASVRQRAKELMALMHVTEAMNRLPAHVSGGEAQRASLARAMMNRPGIIFADEPTGALNRSNTNEVLDLLTGINKCGQSILMVTHDTRAAMRGNRILYLRDGQITSEIRLSPYSAFDLKNREAQINDWLTSMEW